MIKRLKIWLHNTVIESLKQDIICHYLRLLVAIQLVWWLNNACQNISPNNALNEQFCSWK